MSQKKYSLESKAKIAKEAIEGEETTSQIASSYGFASIPSGGLEEGIFLKSFFSKNREKQLEKRIDVLYRK